MLSRYFDQELSSNLKITTGIPLPASVALVIFIPYFINAPPYSSFSLTINTSPIDLSGRVERITDLWQYIEQTYSSTKYKHCICAV